MGINSSNTVQSLTAVSSVAPAKAVTKAVKIIDNSLASSTMNLQDVISMSNQNRSCESILSVPDRALTQAIQHINKIISGGNVELRHTIHKATNSVIITLIDKDTNDILLEIPAEKVLDAFVERMAINGLMVDERR